MSEIFIDRKLYKEASADFYSEEDFEKVVIDNLTERSNQNLKDGNKLYCYEMKCRFTSPYGKTQPDLIILDKNLESFWIVEVELSKHGWSNHVGPQMQKIVDADYSIKASSILDYLKSKGLKENFKDFKEEKFINLIEYGTPDFVLVVNKTPPWEKHAKSPYTNFSYIEIKTFHNKFNEAIYLIEGDHLQIESKTKMKANGKGWYELDDASIFFSKKHGELLKCVFNEQELSLRLTRIASGILLYPQPHDILDPNRNYIINKVKNFDLMQIKEI